MALKEKRLEDTREEEKFIKILCLLYFSSSQQHKNELLTLIIHPSKDVEQNHFVNYC